jgi:adenosylcobinamide-GDP ribazoletransferase
VAAVFCTIATVLMTGGFHEDGLADVADGLGGSYDRERALDIMKDSRIGAFGAMALVLALLAKLCLLALLGAHSLQAALAALVGGHVLSRLWPLLIVRSLPHVGDTAKSKSKPLADQITGAALVAAVLVVLFACSACMASAVSSVFNSIRRLQRPGRRLDGPLVCAAPAGLYR